MNMHASEETAYYLLYHVVRKESSIITKSSICSVNITSVNQCAIHQDNLFRFYWNPWTN